MEENEVKQKKGITVSKEIVISALIGLIIGAVLIFVLAKTSIIPASLITSNTVAKVNGKSIKKSELYDDMKKVYSISYLLEDIDALILDDMYEVDEETQKELDDTAQYYLSMYQYYYGYTEEEFLKANGFDTYEEFIDCLALDYKRERYFNDYLKKQVTEEQINEYYESKVYGKINTKHILVAFDDTTAVEDLYEVAEEIIDKVNSGTTFDEIVEEYGDGVIYEDLGYVGFDSNLETSFMNALLGMQDNTYSKEPVESSYGYHIIYRQDQAEKQELSEIRDAVLTQISLEMESQDEQLYYRTLIEMRKEYGLEFKDDELNEQYEEYCETFTATEENADNSVVAEPENSEEHIHEEPSIIE